VTDYKFGLPVTKAQLEAIGMVAAEWSYLESVIEAAIWTLADVTSEDVGFAITAHLSLRAKLEMLETLFNLREPQGSLRLATLPAIRKSILNDLSPRRNRVIHGRWVSGSHGSPMMFTVQARGTLKRSQKSVDASEIVAIAEETEKQAVRLRELFKIEQHTSAPGPFIPGTNVPMSILNGEDE
jgi:hypothetical protein